MTSSDNNQDLKIVDFGFAAIDTGGMCCLCEVMYCMYCALCCVMYSVYCYAEFVSGDVVLGFLGFFVSRCVNELLDS